MKCPKCGYTSFDYLKECKKCGENLDDCRQALNLKMGEPTLFADFDFDSPAAVTDSANIGADPASKSEESKTILAAGSVAAATLGATAAFESHQQQDFGESSSNSGEYDEDENESHESLESEELELGALEELPEKEIIPSSNAENEPLASEISFSGFESEFTVSSEGTLENSANPSAEPEAEDDFADLQLFDNNDASATPDSLENQAEIPEISETMEAAENLVATDNKVDNDFELELPFAFSGENLDEDNTNEIDEMIGNENEAGTVELELDLDDDESLEDILADLEQKQEEN
jgi:hypothetical protein